jgi:hypothetical protein
MAKKKSSPKRKQPDDPNALAKFIVEKTTGSDKNPAAVALGRLGGRKGGPARARKLSSARRKEIARKAARARWSRREEP